MHVLNKRAAIMPRKHALENADLETKASRLPTEQRFFWVDAKLELESFFFQGIDNAKNMIIAGFE